MSKALVLRRGFTVVELLVVIAIIGTLMTMLLPSMKQARYASQLVACSSNERQTGVAMNTYGYDGPKYNITRPDLGRTNGSWAWETQSVCNDRPVGVPVSGDAGYPSPMNLGITNHGSWLVNNYANSNLYFCPGMSYNQYTPGGWITIQARKTAMAKWTSYWSSAAMGPDDTVSRNAMNATNYCINLGITGPDFNWTGSEFSSGLQGWRLEKMPNYFPVLSDFRGNDGNNSVYSSHEGRGFNVLYTDGTVRFLDIQTIVAAGNSSTMPATPKSLFVNWLALNVSTLNNNTDDSAAGYANNSFNPFAFSGNRTAIWEAYKIIYRGR